MRKHVSSILTFVVLCCVCTGSAFAAHGSVWPLQTRIDEIAAKGGGTLVLTAGVYRTGAIFFKPGVDLHLEKGATIIGVGTGWKNDRHHYLTRPRCIGDPHVQAPLLWLCEALLTGSAAILAAFWTLYLHRGSFAAIQILPKFSGGY